MKKIVIFCLSAFCSFVLSAQDTGDEYLFHRFEYARIFYKNGAIAKADVNYDLTVNKFVYIDPADSLIKEIGEIEKIGAIRTAERSFRMEKGKALEVLSENPELYVEYRGKKTTGGNWELTGHVL